MTSPADLPAVTATTSLEPWLERSALEQLPKRQAMWVVGSGAAAVLAGLTSVWGAQPELALSMALGLGASLVDPRRFWAAPLAVAACGLAGLSFAMMGLPAVIGAGAAAGVVASLLVPQRVDWLDVVHGALGTLAGASLGLWVATTLIPGGVPVALGAAANAGIVSLLASQGLLPIALRFDQVPQLPGQRLVARSLRLPYRPPVFRALDLYQAAQPQAPDRETRRGMAEVATWVYRLQVTMQTLDTELQIIDPDQVRQRIEACRATDDDEDEFTRDRRAATAKHLERLLEHRALIQTERRRTEALVEYALAFLEEARAGLAVAQRLPGEASPDRLPEVLHRLRDHARDGDTRRRTARELGTMTV
ncbi:MAG: hypothetical protein KC621_28720 [Myxococcales bacterium]|nr:hypothetical protein [Myxococcales bacterium]